MIKISRAIAALAGTIASISIGSPAAATNYVETATASDVTYVTQTYWQSQFPGIEVPYTGVYALSGSFDVTPITLDPGDTLTVNVSFTSQSPYPIGTECCFSYIYDVYAVTNSHGVPLGVVTLPFDGEGLFVNSDGFITGAVVYFFAAKSVSDFTLTDGVQLAGEYGLGFVSTPEPASWTLAILGLGFIGAALRFRRRVILA